MTSRRTRKPHPTWVLRLVLRSRISWRSWNLRRTIRRLTRESRRLLLLQRMLDSQYLLLKGLEQQGLLLQEQLQELAESKDFRTRSLSSPPPEQISQQELRRQLLQPEE